MTLNLVDKWAIDIPKNSGLAPCLYIPIAARDRAAIERYVGIVDRVIVSGNPDQVLLIARHPPLERDPLLPIWNHKNVGALHSPKQVWTHVDFKNYRKGYTAALPDVVVNRLVIDHVMNRRVARVKGFAYIRLVAISRGANSSSGGLCEKLQLAYHSTQRMREINAKSPASVQYADLADLVKMLDIKTGNSIMDGVNEAQALVDYPGGKSATQGT